MTLFKMIKIHQAITHPMALVLVVSLDLLKTIVCAVWELLMRLTWEVRCTIKMYSGTSEQGTLWGQQSRPLYIENLSLYLGGKIIY